jgi:hypothetical protein
MRDFMSQEKRLSLTTMHARWCLVQLRRDLHSEHRLPGGTIPRYQNSNPEPHAQRKRHGAIAGFLRLWKTTMQEHISLHANLPPLRGTFRTSAPLHTVGTTKSNICRALHIKRLRSTLLVSALSPVCIDWGNPLLS